MGLPAGVRGYAETGDCERIDPVCGTSTPSPVAERFLSRQEVRGLPVSDVFSHIIAANTCHLAAIAAVSATR